MADSHGQADSIKQALNYFGHHGCQFSYHLGDICDSSHPETANICVHLLRRKNIQCVKGNNDHLVVINQKDHRQPVVSSETVTFLKQLPLAIVHGDAIMTHSLPFEKERGLSSMVGIMGPGEAMQFFQTHPHKLLFRGHNHRPEIMWPRNQTTAIRRLSPGETINLDLGKPAIITCGALDEGFAMIWELDRQEIYCHKFSYPGTHNQT